MISRRAFTLTCCLLLLSLISTLSGCVKDDPVDVLVLQKVQEELAANYDPAIMTNITKWEVFKKNLKIWLADDYDQEKIKEITDKTARAFGTISRTNGKVEATYIVMVYQKRTNPTSGETKVYNIAEGTFYNGKETVEVQLYGLGDGKYDYK
ncbi:MAG: hypothetical protein GEEBNDBF_02240 [bacterium]|nr:hypothetical protein [bacterium]